MKIVRTFLLGSAAGLVAVAGAQAADLPLKAKPVQYVKICSLYGVGFYYIPGTDMCLKIGGWVRAEYAYGDNGNMTWGWANSNVNNRVTNNSTWRARGYITADARNQTEYGTVRGYIAVGVTSNIGTDGAATRSAPTAPSSSGRASPSVWRSRSTTSTACRRLRTGARSRPPTPAIRAGWFVGYTAQFGNGFSATLAAEMRRMTQIVNDRQAVVGQSAPGLDGAGAAHGGFQAPDIVANLRVDQAWGSAQIMGAGIRSTRVILRRCPDDQRPPRRQVGLCGRRRHQAECADDRPGRLLPGPGQLHARRAAVHLPDTSSTGAT